MKSKTRTKGVIAKKVIVSFLLIFGAVAGASAPFLHKLFPKEVYSNSEQGKQLEQNLKEGKITGELYASKKAEIKKSYSFIGFSNKRRFVLAIGYPVSLLICSIYGLIFCKYIDPNRTLFVAQVPIKARKNAVITFTAFMLTAAYFIAWNLWWYKTREDFPKWAYYASLSIIAIVFTFITRALINGWYKEIDNIRSIKNSMIDFLVEVKTVHYKRQLKRAMLKDLHSDSYQESVKADSKEFDKKIYEKAEELID